MSRPRRRCCATTSTDNDLEFTEADGVFSFALPGERKLQTPVRLDLGPHALGVHAFVCRNPDENHERVYRWLLERNLKTYAVSYAVDHLGDIYLDARLPLSLVTPEDLDGVLGSVLAHADGSFNTILELGFASSIRKEWEWRNLRGESTRNLEAFRGWLETDATPDDRAALASPAWSGRSSTCASRAVRSLLRGVTDADLDPLLAVLPDDLEQDPRHQPFLEPAADRRRVLSAEIWQHRGTWSPASWCLDLAVEVDGRVVGVQALEGEEFPLLRTVDSYSWLATEVRGRGLATAMRTGGARPRLRPPRRGRGGLVGRRSTTRRRWPSRDVSGTPTTGSAGPTRRTA